MGKPEDKARVIMAVILLLSLCLAPFGSHAQSHDSLNVGQSDKMHILLLPFESRMILSDINRLLGSRYHMELDDVRTAFQTESLGAFFKSKNPAITITALHPEDSNNALDLRMIYGAANYGQKVMENKSGNKKEPVDKPDLLPQMEHGRPYMAALLKDSARWRDQQVKHAFDRMIWITQLEIKNTTPPEEATSATGYLVRWHFCMFNAHLQQTDAGAISIWMPIDSAIDLWDNLKARLRDLAEAVMRQTHPIDIH